MINDKSNHKPVILAAITASVLMLIFGLTYQVLAARLLAPMSETPIDSNALELMPMQFGDWTGEDDVPLDESLLSVIATEAYINRRYSRNNDLESISLFVAASGTTAGNLIGHPPEVCNVMAGYTFMGQHLVELPLSDTMKLSCRILQFSRGGLLDQEKKIVLVYYVADGEFYGTKDQLRLRVRRGSNMVNCTAQVQITASSKETLTTDSMVRIVSDFAVDSASSIAELFEHIQKDQNVDSPRAIKEGGSR